MPFSKYFVSWPTKNKHLKFLLIIFRDLRNYFKVSKGANESQEFSPFPAGDHNEQINRRAQSHNKHKTEQNIKDPKKKYRFGTVS